MQRIYSLTILAVLAALVKPQFEAGRSDVARGEGVIRDPAVPGNLDVSACFDNALELLALSGRDETAVVETCLRLAFKIQDGPAAIEEKVARRPGSRVACQAGIGVGGTAFDAHDQRGKGGGLSWGLADFFI